MRKKLQKLRQRKYFDSGEYYLQNSGRQVNAGAGEFDAEPFYAVLTGNAHPMLRTTNNG